MKRYELLKWYPSLRTKLNVGDIVEMLNTGEYYRKNNTIPALEVENSPEFWREVKEYVFEILQIKSKQTGTIFDRVYTPGVFISWIQEQYTIYTVKRKTDGITFSIGDKVNNPKLQKPMPFIITEFYFDCNNEHLLCNGEHCGNGHINITKIEHYKEPSYKILESCPIEGTIYSVERISDGEVFTVGDMCSPNSMNNPAKITKFEFVLGDQLRIQGMEGINRYWYLDITSITKIKIPLFITEDGKEIFEGDLYVSVQTLNYTIIGTYNGRIGADSTKGLEEKYGKKYFSSIEAANNYIKLYKPTYSNFDMLKFGKTCFTNGTLKNYGTDIKTLLENYKK